MADTPDITTCLRRIDEIREALADVEKEMRHELGADIKELGEKLSATNERIDERTAALKDQLNKLDRENLTEGFSIKKQVAEIGWRVGVVVGIAMFLLTFIFKNLEIADFIGGKSDTAQSGRKGGR